MFNLCSVKIVLINEEPHHALNHPQFNHIKRATRWPLKFNDVSDDDKCLHLGKWFNPFRFGASSSPERSHLYFSSLCVPFRIRNISFSVFICFLLVLVPPFKYSLSCSAFLSFHFFILCFSILHCYHQQQVFSTSRKKNNIRWKDIPDFNICCKFSLNIKRQMIRMDVEGFHFGWTFALNTTIFGSFLLGGDWIREAHILWDGKMRFSFRLHAHVHNASFLCTLLQQLDDAVLFSPSQAAWLSWKKT